MTKTEEIIKAWAGLFDSTAIKKNYTNKAFSCEVLNNLDTQDKIQRLKRNGEFNFIEYLVRTNAVVRQVGGCSEMEHEITVRYYVEDDGCDCTKQVQIMNFFEELAGLVESKLGKTWNGTVSTFNFPLDFPSVSFFGSPDGNQEANLYLGEAIYTARSR